MNSQVKFISLLRLLKKTRHICLGEYKIDRARYSVTNSTWCFAYISQTYSSPTPFPSLMCSPHNFYCPSLILNSPTVRLLLSALSAVRLALGALVIRHSCHRDHPRHISILHRFLNPQKMYLPLRHHRQLPRD